MSFIEKRAQRVICISTGQVYRSIRDAARSAKMNPSSMLRAIKTGRMSAGKYWRILPAELSGSALDQWRMAELLSAAGYEHKEVTKMRKLINYTEMVGGITEMLMEHEIGCYKYQRDIYLYVDENGTGKLEIFDNIDGNSWLDDDHINVCGMSEINGDWSDVYQDVTSVADVLECSEEHLRDSVCEWIAVDTGHHYEIDEIEYNDVYQYIREHEPLRDIMMRAREDVIRDQYPEYVESAKVLLHEALIKADIEW